MDFALQLYEPDPNSREARRRRRIVASGLFFFCLFYGLAFAFFAPFLMVMFVVPLVLVAAFVIWALPETQNPPIRSLQSLFFMYIIALAVWPNNLAIALPGIPWITFVRIFLFPMTLVTLICLSTSPNFRSELGKAIYASRWISILVVMFVGVQLFSIFLAQDKGSTLQSFLISQINWTALFFTSIYVYLKPGRAILYSRIAWGLTVFVCLMGLIEWKLGKVPWQGHIPSFLKIDDPWVAMELAGYTRSGVGVHRVQSIFTHPTTLSEYLALVAPFIVDFAVKPNRFRVRFAAAATLVVMAFVVYLTNSRTGSIGFLVAFLVYGSFWSLEQRRMHKGGLLGSAVFYGYPIAAFFGVLASVFIGRIRNKVWGGSETAASTTGREMQWEKGIPIIKHNPFGHGVGQSGVTLQYREPNGMLTVDSYYLSQLLEVGVIGFIIYYAIWAVGIAYTSRTAMKIGQKDPELSLLIPITCALINFLIIKSVFSQIDNHPLVYSFLGMGVALVYRAKVKMNAAASASVGRSDGANAFAAA